MKLWNPITTLFTAVLPNCREAARAQSEALDHPLPPLRRAGLWLHLLMCRWCRRYRVQIQFLGRAAREHEETLINATPQNLPPEARDRIKQKLRAGL